MNDRLRTWLKRTLAGVGALIVLLPVLVFGVLQTGSFKDWLRKFAIEQAESALNARLEIEKVDGTLLGSLVVEGVRLEGDDGELLASIERLEADYEIFGALSGELEIDEVVIRGALVRVVQTEAGVNFARIVPPSPDEPESAPPDFRIALPNVRLENSTVIWADLTRVDNVPTSAEDVSMTADAAPGATAYVSELKLEGRSDLDLAGVLAAELSLESRGAVSGIGSGAFKATNVRWSMNQSGQQRASIETLNGLDLAVLEKVSATLEPTPEMPYSASIGSLKVGPDINPALSRLEAGFAIETPVETKVRVRGDLENLQARVDLSTELAGALEAEGALRGISSQRPQYEVRLIARDLRAHEIVSGLDLPRHQLNLWADASGSGFEPETLEADLRLGLERSRIDDFFIQTLYLEARALEGKITLEKFGVDTPYARARANASFDQGDQTFTLRAEADSEDELGKLTGGKLESKSKLEAQIDASGRLDLDAEFAAGTLVDGKIFAKWDIGDFSAENLRIDSSKGRVDLRVGAPREDLRSVNFDLDLNVKRARYDDYRLDSLQAKGSGSTRVALPVESLADVIRGADLKLNADVRRLDAPGIAKIGETKVNAKINALDGRTYRYDLDAKLADVDVPGVLTTQRLDADLEGVLGLDSSGTRPTRLDSKGSVDLVETRAFDQSVGKARIALDVRGPTRNLEGSVKVRAEDAKVPPYDFAEVRADLNLKDKRRFELDVEGTPTSGRPETIQISVTGSYSEDLQTFEVDDVSLTGSGDSWKIENGLVAQTDDGRYRFRNLKLTHGADQRVTLDGVYRPGRDQDLRLKLENLAITQLPREFGIDVPPVRGRIDGEVQLDGTSKEPRAYVNLTLSDLYYEGYGPFSITLTGLYEDERLYISEADVTGYAVHLLEMTAIAPIRFTLDGEFDVLEDEDFSLLTTIVPFDIEKFHGPLPVLAQYGARAQVSGEIAFFGRLSNPYMETQLNLNDAEITASLASGDDVRVGPVRVISNVKYAPLGSQQGGFRGAVSLRDRNNEGFQARASAQIPLEEWLTYAARGELDKIKAEDWMNAPFELLLLLPSYDVSKVNISSFEEAKAEGNVDVYVQAGGTIINPTGQVRARLADFGWNRFRDIYIDLDTDFGNEQLSINNFKVNWDADDIFSASATLPVPIEDVLAGKRLEDLPLTARVQLLEIPIAKLSAVDYTFASIAGSVQADIKLAGKLSAPQFDGTAKFDGVVFSDGRPGSLALDINARRDRVIANANLTHQKSKSLTFSAGLPLNLNLVGLAQGEEVLAKGPISGSLFARDLPVASMIPRRILDDYAQKIKGTLNTDLSVRGTYEAPQISGAFKLSGFSAFFPDLGRTIDEGNIHVNAKANSIDIVELYAKEGNGYLDADGKVVLSNFKPQTANLNIAMSELSTSGFSPLPAYVTGNADVQADLTTDVIDTKVTLRDLDIAIPDTAQSGTHPLELSPDVEILNPRESREGMITLDDVESQIGERGQFAKVQVKIEPNSWVHHPNADIQFRGDLALDVGQRDTVILGDISTVDGQLEFLGKEFTMRQGIVSFSGNTPPNPRLQVEAVYALDRSITEAVGPSTSGEPKAVVRVTGPARNPQLRLSSDPQMTESQIIYVLVTDRPPADPNEEQGVAGQAVAAASGLLSGLLKQRAAKYTPIDTFRLTTDSEGISGVELGRYFGKNLFFAYQYQFAAEQGENVSEFRIEYTLDFAPSWLVGTRFGDQGNGAVFIFWDVL